MSGVILVAGGGGFIGGALASSLVEDGHAVRVVDLSSREHWCWPVEGADCLQRDLRLLESCLEVVRGCSHVYNFACDMGGMGFIEHNKAATMLSSLINTHLLVAARELGVQRYFFASTACVYRADRQSDTKVIALREDADVYPAMPEDGYGWEKLFGEHMCRHFHEDFGLDTRVARYHNVYGPHGTWDGGREKVPAAICRKVATAVLTGDHQVEVWGDGEQVRSFTYIDDAVEGTRKLMESDVTEPRNIGSSETASINQLVDLVAQHAGIEVTRNHDLSAPQGVRGRSSDNTLVRRDLGWTPTTALRDGIGPTYDWVFAQVKTIVDRSLPKPVGGAT
jgi:nucleoside-diphosphate-sugar epimerase